MAHQNLNRKNPSPLGASGNSVPLYPELLIDEGAWLKIEEDANSPGISQKICKRSLVSLHVTLEDSEHECSLWPILQKSSNPEMPEGSRTDKGKK